LSPESNFVAGVKFCRHLTLLPPSDIFVGNGDKSCLHLFLFWAVTNFVHRNKFVKKFLKFCCPASRARTMLRSRGNFVATHSCQLFLSVVVALVTGNKLFMWGQILSPETNFVAGDKFCCHLTLCRHSLLSVFLSLVVALVTGDTIFRDLSLIDLSQSTTEMGHALYICEYSRTGSEASANKITATSHFLNCFCLIDINSSFQLSLQAHSTSRSTCPRGPSN